MACRGSYLFFPFCSTGGGRPAHVFLKDGEFELFHFFPFFFFPGGESFVFRLVIWRLWLTVVLQNTRFLPTTAVCLPPVAALL